MKCKWKNTDKCRKFYVVIPNDGDYIRLMLVCSRIAHLLENKTFYLSPNKEGNDVECSYISFKTKINGKWKHEFFHRTVLDLKRGDGKFCDHINHNGRDSRPCNLRIATRSQNSHNRRVPPKGYDGYEKKWRARIAVDEIMYWSPFFKKESTAAKYSEQQRFQYNNNLPIQHKRTSICPKQY